MRLRRPPPTIADATWREVLARHALVRYLGEDERTRLRAMAARFLRSKSLEPVRDLELDDADLIRDPVMAMLYKQARRKRQA